MGSVVPLGRGSFYRELDRLGPAFDICDCGDYRYQHNHAGGCTVCGHSTHPADGCREFRLALRGPRP